MKQDLIEKARILCDFYNHINIVTLFNRSTLSFKLYSLSLIKVKAIRSKIGRNGRKSSCEKWKFYGLAREKEFVIPHMIECLNKKDCRHICHQNCTSTKSTCSLMLYTSRRKQLLPQEFPIFCLTKRVTTQHLYFLFLLYFKTRVNDVEIGTHCTETRSVVLYLS